MEGAGDNGVEWVVKHKRFSLPVAVKATRRNRAPTANSSMPKGPTYHSLASAPELIRRHWFVAPRSGSKKLTMAVVPPEDTHGDAGSLGRYLGVVLIVGGLTFFPALALGPIVEHLAMGAGTLFSSN